MKKSTPVVLVIAASVIFITAMFFIRYYTGVELYSSDKGPLTVAPGKTAALKGPWFFTWDAFLPSSDAETADETVEMPYPWHSFIAGRGYPLTGRTTYAFTLKTEDMRGRNAFFIPAVNSAWRLFMNGKEIAESGVPAGTAEEEKASGQPQSVFFDQTADSLDIILHVSNHVMFNSGFGQGQQVEYGRASDIQARLVELILGDAFLFVLLIFIGLVSLFWFFNSPKEVHNAVFSVISLLYAFRVLLTGMMLVYTVFPFFTARGVSLSLMITYFVSLPIFLAYFRHSFPCEFPLWIPAAALAAAAAASLVVLVTEPALHPRIIAGFGVLVALGGVYALFRLTVAVKRKRRNAGIVLVSAVIIIACGLNDILFSSGLIQSVLLMNAGIGVFGLMQILILGSSSRRTFRELYGVHHTLRVMQSWQDIFFSTASMDLQKPLQGIRDVSDSLLRGSLGPITSDQLGGLSLINAGALQLSNMVSNILDFRRISEGTIDASRRTVNLFMLIERVKAASSLIFREKNLEFKNTVPRDMDTIYTDESLLERTCYSIAGGFAEYNDAGVLTVSAESLEQEIRISIIWESDTLDRGKAIKAFCLFEAQAADRKSGEATGADLGLSIARRIIEIQGGQFLFGQDPEKPFEIVLVLPRFAADSDREATEEEEAHLDSLINLEPVLEDVVLTRNIDIMVVSAELMELQVMKSQLASMNYNVIPVTSGSAALEKIQEKCPNLVLLDVYLHDMSGYEICSSIREHWSSSELPVILITEKEKVSDLMQGLTSGANDFLARPYHMEEFLTRVNTHIQLARINQMYSRFVPTEFLNTLGQDNIIDLKLGDQVQREMTVLFVDIRAFTNLSENMTPQENFKFINSYLSRFSPMITRNNGFVDKFIGDAIMALYPGKPEDAIQTALEMVEHVKVYNGHRASCGYNPINIGIGIHTGNLILGIIGDDQRMQGTVISDAVNLASRIQDVTKLYHTSIVISQETFVQLENPMSYDFRFLGKVKVKGKAKSVSLFEIFNGDTDELRALKSETKNDFETAIILFAKRRFEEAEVILEDIAAKNPQDYAARLFLDRAKKFLSAEKRAYLSSI